jgi:hypothetical protein
MNRREFLKVLSAIPATLLVPKLNLQNIPSEEVSLGIVVEERASKYLKLLDGTWFITPDGDRFPVEDAVVSEYIDQLFPIYFTPLVPLQNHIELVVTIIGYYEKAQNFQEIASGYIVSEFTYFPKSCVWCEYTANNKEIIELQLDDYTLIQSVKI